LSYHRQIVFLDIACPSAWENIHALTRQRLVGKTVPRLTLMGSHLSHGDHFPIPASVSDFDSVGLDRA
jgi:hypothetical protein